MLLQQKLSNLFLILFCLVSVGLNAAETRWEVAIVFRGNAEDEQFQKDIDENILELARITPSSSLKIGIYRELEGRSYSYLPAGTSKKEITLGDVLYRQDLNQLKINGTLKKNTSSDLDAFLKSFYQNSTAKKALVIYSHGKGAAGLRGLETSDLKNALAELPPLDLVWFDACFMANFEFLYELRTLSQYTIASEEAEFAAGLPFQALALLPSLPSAKEAALALAKNFIESYSYLQNGKQRSYVTTSSATISVIENKKLESLASSLKWVSAWSKKLTDDQKKKLTKVLSTRAAMDDKSLVDLGILLIELRKMNSITAIDAKLTTLIRLLNIESVKNLKTSPRVQLLNPRAESKLVYGFNHWQDGSSEDLAANGVFDSIIQHDGVLAGPHGRQWPYKNFKSQKIVLSPFAPGINVFNYYFLHAQNGQLLSEAMSISRTHDIVESPADSLSSPLLYSAYTQQIGFKAERYTGLNITMPGSVPSLDYFELEFNQLAEWLSL